MKPTKKELRIQKVTRALLDDVVPPPMDSPTKLTSGDVWVTLESGETLKAFFHCNGYSYITMSNGYCQREDEGIFRWKKDATIGGGGATVKWRDERPWVLSWSKESPTTVSGLGNYRKRFLLLRQTILPRLLAHPAPTPALPGSPSRKAPRAPRAAKRG